MEKNKLFWLHIKKAGGTSMREIFVESFYELQDERYTYPATFIAYPKEKWNDTLNNYRVPLGRYDYKRMLYAKTFLYTEEEWESMYKFVVIRDPYDRILSNWKYLFRKRFFDYKYNRMKYSFNEFLKKLPDYMGERFEQIYHHGYIGLHAAPIWPDITDDNDNLLVDKIVRLENYNEDIQEINDLYNVDLSLKIHKNKSRTISNKEKYFNRKNLDLINRIFEQDIINLPYDKR